MTGTGTALDPFIISTPADLDDGRNDLSAYYELANDIDMAAWGNFNPIGIDSDTAFTGHFDGKGYKISNLSIDKSSVNTGLFAYLYGGTIQNVAIIDADVNNNSYNYTGILVGYMLNGIVTNCYTTGNISGQYGVGGLVGYFVSGGSISNCFSHANATGTGRVGGLIGNGSDNSYVDKCYSSGLVTVTPNPDLYNGGLIGSHNDASDITNSYYDNETSGQTVSAGGTGKTTAQMKTQSTYAGWDFSSTWGIVGDYPYLQVFGVPSVPAKVETIEVTTHVNYLDSDADKKVKKTKQTQSHINILKSSVNSFSATLRNVSTYTIPIKTSVQKATRSVKTASETVTSFISPFTANVQRKVKSLKRLSSFVGKIKSTAETDKIVLVNAHTSYVENPSFTSIDVNKTSTSYIENPSFVEVIE